MPLSGSKNRFLGTGDAMTPTNRFVGTGHAVTRSYK
jgi:hypothetical protein